ncbi:hypothetical protein QOT17_002411 [Balamuthia mandrillaris]
MNSFSIMESSVINGKGEGDRVSLLRQEIDGLEKQLDVELAQHNKPRVEALKKEIEKLKEEYSRAMFDAVMGGSWSPTPAPRPHVATSLPASPLSSFTTAPASTPKPAIPSTLATPARTPGGKRLAKRTKRGKNSLFKFPPKEKPSTSASTTPTASQSEAETEASHAPTSSSSQKTFVEHVVENVTAVATDNEAETAQKEINKESVAAHVPACGSEMASQEKANPEVVPVEEVELQKQPSPEQRETNLWSSPTEEEKEENNEEQRQEQQPQIDLAPMEQEDVEAVEQVKEPSMLSVETELKQTATSTITVTRIEEVPVPIGSGVTAEPSGHPMIELTCEQTFTPSPISSDENPPDMESKDAVTLQQLASENQDLRRRTEEMLAERGYFETEKAKHDLEVKSLKEHIDSLSQQLEERRANSTEVMLERDAQLGALKKEVEELTNRLIDFKNRSTRLEDELKKERAEWADEKKTLLSEIKMLEESQRENGEQISTLCFENVEKEKEASRWEGTAKQAIEELESWKTRFLRLEEEYRQKELEAAQQSPHQKEAELEQTLAKLEKMLQQNLNDAQAQRASLEASLERSNDELNNLRLKRETLQLQLTETSQKYEQERQKVQHKAQKAQEYLQELEALRKGQQAKEKEVLRATEKAAALERELARERMEEGVGSRFRSILEENLIAQSEMMYARFEVVSQELVEMHKRFDWLEKDAVRKDLAEAQNEAQRQKAKAAERKRQLQKMEPFIKKLQRSLEEAEQHEQEAEAEEEKKGREDITDESEEPAVTEKEEPNKTKTRVKSKSVATTKEAAPSTASKRAAKRGTATSTTKTTKTEPDAEAKSKPLSTQPEKDPSPHRQQPPPPSTTGTAVEKEERSSSSASKNTGNSNDDSIIVEDDSDWGTTSSAATEPDHTIIDPLLDPAPRSSTRASSTSPSSLLRSPSKRIHTHKKVIYFSGFKPDDPIYNHRMKESLATASLKLGGAEVRWDAEFDTQITHVIAPPDSRTMKTLAAALTGRWLMAPEWVLDSQREGRWLEEKSYGTCYAERPFALKRFYMAPSFRKENEKKNHKLSNAHTLIVKLGRGTVVTKPENVDFTLVATNNQNASEVHGIPVTWAQFVNMIPGATASPPPPASSSATTSTNPTLTSVNEAQQQPSGLHIIPTAMEETTAGGGGGRGRKRKSSLSSPSSSQEETKASTTKKKKMKVGEHPGEEEKEAEESEPLTQQQQQQPSKTTKTKATTTGRKKKPTTTTKTARRAMSEQEEDEGDDKDEGEEITSSSSQKTTSSSSSSRGTAARGAKRPAKRTAAKRQAGRRGVDS